MNEATSPIVCILSPNELGARLDEFFDLFGQHLLSATQPEVRRAKLVLRAAGSVEAAARDLLAREQECCAFFTFDVQRVGETLIIEALVPDGVEAALEGFTSVARRAAPRAFK